MKAVYIESQGGPEVLTYGERPEPEVKQGEVKVRVKATSLNRLDLYTRAGGRGLDREFPPPLILFQQQQVYQQHFFALPQQHF